MIYFCRVRKFCAPPHHSWKLYSICCQLVAWYELKQTIIISPIFFNPKLAQSANSIYGFYKFRRDASKELLEQLQSRDNIPQKLFPFTFITTTSNGTQLHIILPTIMPSIRVKSLNWQKQGRKEEMKPCWWKYPKFLQNLFGLFCFVKIACLQWKGLKINLLKLNLVSIFHFFGGEKAKDNFLNNDGARKLKNVA